MDFVQLAIWIYISGLVLWFLVWHFLVGYDWLNNERLLYIPFVGGIVAFIVNAYLASIATIPEYGIEIGIYGFVETNAITVAGFSLGIAVFVVLTFEKTMSILDHEESKKFLTLVFSSFLFSILGVLPLYWVPQIYGWLTTLRHLKTVPYLYSVFLLASAMVIYLYEIRKDSSPKAKKK